MTAYDAVLWDVGGVLLDPDSVRAAHRAFVERLVRERDVDADAADALSTWRDAVGAHFRERDGTAFRSAVDAYGRGVDAVVGTAVPRESWFDAFRTAGRDHLRATAGARDVLAALGDAGVYQAVVSDADTAELAFILDHLGLRGYLDDVTSSESVGRTKPDDRMFETALSKSPAPADRTLMVGDRYEHDVAGAVAHGIHPVAFGAADGPAVEYRIADLREALGIVGVDA